MLCCKIVPLTYHSYESLSCKDVKEQDSAQQSQLLFSIVCRCIGVIYGGDNRSLSQHNLCRILEIHQRTLLLGVLCSGVLVYFVRILDYGWNSFSAHLNTQSLAEGITHDVKLPPTLQHVYMFHNIVCSSHRLITNPSCVFVQTLEHHLCMCMPRPSQVALHRMMLWWVAWQNVALSEICAKCVLDHWSWWCSVSKLWLTCSWCSRTCRYKVKCAYYCCRAWWVSSSGPLRLWSASSEPHPAISPPYSADVLC